MSTDLTAPSAQDVERVLISGDLAKLTPEQRLSYLNRVCESMGLNPLTQPFAFLSLNGKTVLYALKSCTEQLRTLHNISLVIVARELHEDVYVVTAQAVRVDGRRDESTGAVSIGGLKGEAKANAMMKAETKAKRRVTLSICGLGILDESEADSIPGAFQGTREDQMHVAQQRIEELKQSQLAPGNPSAANARITEAAAIISQPPENPNLVVEVQAPRQSKEQKAFQQEYLTLPPDLRAMVDKFQVIKRDLKKITGSDDKYREILGNNGHEKSTQIRFSEEGERIYQEMKQAFVDAMENATKSKPELLTELGKVLVK